MTGWMSCKIVLHCQCVVIKFLNHIIKYLCSLISKEQPFSSNSHCAGGSGGKGTWGGLLETDDMNILHHNDPNYDSNEVNI